MEAIRLSKEQTKGYKWDLFILDLSFLGWVILSVFTLGLLTIWLTPYMTLTVIAYYDTICSLKGMTAAGQSGWAHGAPDDGPYQPPYQANGEQQNSPWNGASAQQPERPPYDYDWNHQNNSWNSAGTGTDAAAPEQPQTPPALQMPDPPAAPEVPQQPESRSGADPWERKENQEPWNRGDQNTP